MKKNRLHKTYGILFITLFLCSSCKQDWFDIRSNNALIVPNSLTDFRGLLDNDRVMNSYSPSLGEIGSDGHFVTDLSFNSFLQNFKNAYSWSHTQPYMELADWGGNNLGPYFRIYNCNLILDGLNKITDKSLAFKTIKGEALFQRARTFYELSQVFAAPYLLSNSNSELGIPLRLEADINIPSKRSTLKETYDQIINDLLLARDLLPDLPDFKMRGSKAAVYALLSRIYLSIENYENAERYANLCLNIYSVLMNYNLLDGNAVQPISIFNPEVIFHASMLNSQSISSIDCRIEKSLYDEFEAEDNRKKVFFINEAISNTTIFKGTYSSSGLQFTGLATDEIYLIRAECNARTGNVTQAMKDLNILLRYRYKPGFIEKKAINKEDALKQILNERKKELMLRGLRWSDLRRLNRDDRFKTTILRTINGKIYTLEPNSFKYTFPIPDDILKMTGMKQNVGW